MEVVDLWLCSKLFPLKIACDAGNVQLVMLKMVLYVSKICKHAFLKVLNDEVTESEVHEVGFEFQNFHLPTSQNMSMSGNQVADSYISRTKAVRTYGNKKKYILMHKLTFYISH